MNSLDLHGVHKDEVMILLDMDTSPLPMVASTGSTEGAKNRVQNVYTPLGHTPALAPPAHPGIVRDFELPDNSWQIRQVAGV